MLETRLKFYVTDEQIYQFYLEDEIEVGVKYSAPWRSDNTPSLSFNYYNGFLMWTDFGLQSDVYRDGIGFVQQLFDLNREKAVRKIWKELVLNKDVPLRVVNIKKKIKFDYEITFIELSNYELEYWGRLQLSLNFLKRFNVWSLKSMRRLGKKIWWSTEENPTYVYLFKDYPKAFKAYRPLDPRKDKFRGQNNGAIVEGWDQLPEQGEDLIISSSLKDTMVLTKCGFNACNPTSENSFRGILNKKDELNERFKNIRILFDNDIPGINAANSLYSKTGWETMFLPQKLSKDPSDYIMNGGNYKTLKNMLI